MAEERTIDDLLRELGYGDVADMAPVKTRKEKTKAKVRKLANPLATFPTETKAKVKDLIIEGVKAKKRGLSSNTQRLLDQIDD